MKHLLIWGLFILSPELIAQEKLLVDTVAVNSIDGIVNEVLEIISVEKGEGIDLEKFRNLFVPNARFSMLVPNDSIPQPLETISLDEFIEMLDDPYYEQGYLEYEMGKVVDEYNVTRPSNSWRHCERCRTCGWCGRPMRAKRWKPGSWPSIARPALRCWC